MPISVFEKKKLKIQGIFIDSDKWDYKGPKEIDSQISQLNFFKYIFIAKWTENINIILLPLWVIFNKFTIWILIDFLHFLIFKNIQMLILSKSRHKDIIYKNKKISYSSLVIFYEIYNI
ncbi:unnamed protein product [Blepharisma stoltei]|uniref:Uncharacterized protein n=1 Tax=Blepharisma stoltei TaxID=1481888 RepID=A0AAU9K241_9CILI|nr:unnamed protein product [Blepharisma stoltei]